MAKKHVTWRNQSGKESLTDVKLIPADGKGRKVPQRKSKYAYAAGTYRELLERQEKHMAKAQEYEAEAARATNPIQAQKYRDHASIRRVQAQNAKRKTDQMWIDMLAKKMAARQRLVNQTKTWGEQQRAARQGILEASQPSPGPRVKRGRFTITTLSPM